MTSKTLLLLGLFAFLLVVSEMAAASARQSGTLNYFIETKKNSSAYFVRFMFGSWYIIFRNTK